MLSRTERFQIPEKIIRDGEKIIFYGGGEVGKAYLELSNNLKVFFLRNDICEIPQM